ncbi:unnamed protein product [Rhodiola kirilowii]
MQELEQGKQGALTTQTRDPGAFTVTCGFGNTLIPHCLIDLGASINVMPYDLYCSLKLGPMEDTQTKESPTLILGRPILFATKAKIDVAEGTIVLKYGGKMAEFRVFEDGHQPCAGKLTGVIVPVKNNYFFYLRLASGKSGRIHRDRLRICFTK